MRFIALLGLCACARPVPATETAPLEHDEANERAVDSTAEPVVVLATPRNAQELIDEVGLSTFLEDQRLRISTADHDAAERWFRRPPQSVYFHSDEPIEVARETTVRGECQRVRRSDDVVSNEIDFVVWRRNRERTLLELGFHDVDVAEQILDEGEWRTGSGGPPLMKTIAWDDDHIVYAEGATRYEVACVPALRTVSCGDVPFRGATGHCVDREP